MHSLSMVWVLCSEISPKSQISKGSYKKLKNNKKNWLWSSLNVILMLHILATSANETISEKTGDYCPVFYNVFAQFAQSAEMLRNALQHTDRKRRLQAWSIHCSCCCYLWWEAGGYFSLDNFSILFLWPNWYCANKQRVSFTLFQNKCSPETRFSRQ